MTPDEYTSGPSTKEAFEDELGRLIKTAARKGVDLEGASVHTTDDDRTVEVLITAVEPTKD